MKKRFILCSNIIVLVIIISLMLSPYTAFAWWSKTSNLKKSIVKIYGTYQRDNFLYPWQAGRPSQGSGSGFIIKGRKILTNAHVVSNARFLEVQREGNAKRYPAEILFVAHDCDLALITVRDDEFFKGLGDADLLQIADVLPDLNEEVIAMGYPMGGDRISITKGVVSRIDYGIYSHSGLDSHLILQIDAAINPGNSGGPVLYKNKVIGVAFQGIPGSQNIGYAIPIQVIKHFLADIADGSYDGYPELGIEFRQLVNPALQKQLGLPDPQYGIAVSYVDPFGCAAGYMLPGDILLNIDDSPIYNDGTIEIDGQQLLFFEIFERKLYGETVKFKLIRNGSVQEVKIVLQNKNDPFTFRYIYDKKPDYYTIGGLVFSPLSRELIAALGYSAGAQLYYLMNYVKVDDLYKDRQEFVVLIARLPHPINTYCDPFMLHVLDSINGVKIASLADIKEALQRSNGKFHIFKFLNKDDELVMDASELDSANSAIQTTYGLPSLYRLSNENE